MLFFPHKESCEPQLHKLHETKEKNYTTWKDLENLGNDLQRTIEHLGICSIPLTVSNHFSVHLFTSYSLYWSSFTSYPSCLFSSPLFASILSSPILHTILYIILHLVSCNSPFARSFLTSSVYIFPCAWFQIIIPHLLFYHLQLYISLSHLNSAHPSINTVSHYDTWIRPTHLNVKCDLTCMNSGSGVESN